MSLPFSGSVKEHVFNSVDIAFNNQDFNIFYNIPDYDFCHNRPALAESVRIKSKKTVQLIEFL